VAKPKPARSSGFPSHSPRRMATSPTGTSRVASSPCRRQPPKSPVRDRRRAPGRRRRLMDVFGSPSSEARTRPVAAASGGARCRPLTPRARRHERNLMARWPGSRAPSGRRRVRAAVERSASSSAPTREVRLEVGGLAVELEHDDELNGRMLALMSYGWNPYSERGATGSPAVHRTRPPTPRTRDHRFWDRSRSPSGRRR
jgi:hypothetical protein